MKLLCVGGIADGRTINWDESRDTMVLAEMPRLSSGPVPVGKEPRTLRQQVYKRIDWHFGDTRGGPFSRTLCAAPADWTHSEVMHMLVRYYKRDL